MRKGDTGVKEYLLAIDNLKKSYNIRDKLGRRKLLRAVDGVSFTVSRGETLGLVGESGCGKTTLGRTILRLSEPDSGRIIYDGDDITHVSMRPYRRKMQIVFQDPFGSLDPRSRIFHTVEEGLKVNYPMFNSAQRRNIVLGLLESVGLDRSHAYRYPHEFSGGQQQRIGIARALSVEPEFIVCDEPVSALDVSYQAQILRLLKELQDTLSLTYLFISHDLSVVRYISDRIGVMYLGKLIELGTSIDVTGNPAHQYTKALLNAVPLADPRVRRAEEHRLMEDPADFTIPEKGCRYCRLCEKTIPACFEEEPMLREVAPGHSCACHVL
ncbi:MAG: ABC transporter ATP-binding protein [Clostridiales bacterium]|nr:ABC transporter ATP-binding protein [Clostridiales bacterium]